MKYYIYYIHTSDIIKGKHRDLVQLTDRSAFWDCVIFHMWKITVTQQEIKNKTY